MGTMGDVVHNNGCAWLPMTAPVITTFRGIFGTPATNVFAAGDNGVVLLGTQ